MSSLPRQSEIMFTRRQQLLDQALQLSQRMAELGAAGEWQQVIELEPQRSAVLHSAFDVDAKADETTAQQVSAILAVDRRLMNLGVVARDQAAVELGQMQRGRKVKQAYRSAGS